MATNEIDIDASPEDVFALWADGERYAEWVVGAKEIRHADPQWPKIGSKIHHSIGIGPVTLQDNTEVVEVDEPNHIALTARARPFGRARVDLRVERQGQGSRVVMEEWVLGIPGFLARLADPPIAVRNTEALRRLKDIVESQS
jgi:uncharacterized protein YndB with AHSA1/START domain